MAILGFRTGSWGTPEFGITEKISDLLGKPRDSQGGSSILGTPKASSTPPSYTPPSSTPPSSGPVLGTNTFTRTPSTGTTQPQQQTTQSQTQPLVDLRQQELDAINSEYGAEIARLTGLEGTTRSQYGEAGTGLDTQYNQSKDILSSEQANREGQIASESNSALAKVRSMLNDLNRRQQAYLSATGGYSSSTSDALGEQFGRQAFQSLGEVQKRRDQEMANVSQFYKSKAVELEQTYGTQKAELNRQLLSALDSINSAKGQAESAKRQASLDAWRSYTNNLLQLDAYTKQRQDTLSQWLTQMQASVDGARGYSTNYNVTDLYNNINNALTNVGTKASNLPSVVSRVTGKSSDDELSKVLAGLNTPYVAGMQ